MNKKGQYKFLLLIDSFKGSISSKEIEKYISSKLPNCDYYPLSDGGEGFIDAISNIKKGRIQYLETKSLIGNEIKVKVFFDENKNAFICSSDIIGLHLIGDSSIYNRSSYGLGTILLELNKYDLKKVYVGLGGTGILDMGLGLLKALNIKFFNDNKTENITKINGIFDADRLDMSNMKQLHYQLNIINDVINPLLGPSGANYVYAKQKGANEKDIIILEKAYCYFYNLLKSYIKNSDDNIGDGSAGGLGFIFKHVLNAKYYQGIDFILDMIDYDNLISQYDFVITGEGKLDEQSLDGKVIGGILKRTRKEKMIAIVGSQTISVDFKTYPLVPMFADNINETIKNPKKYLLAAILCLKKDLSIIKHVKHSFPPFYNSESEILILGSFPSIDSRKSSFYYMNSQNRFYRVLSRIFNEEIPLSIEEKQRFLLKHHIALYDVVEECDIEGSKDNMILNPKIANIEEIINKSKIKKIVLNGNKAKELYVKNFNFIGKNVYFLPSTSSANASCHLENLIELYKNALLN